MARDFPRVIHISDDGRFIPQPFPLWATAESDDRLPWIWIVIGWEVSPSGRTGSEVSPILARVGTSAHPLEPDEETFTSGDGMANRLAFHTTDPRETWEPRTSPGT